MTTTLANAPSVSLEDLWRSQSTDPEASPLATGTPFNPDAFTHLPSLAQRYLTQAIAPSTPLAAAVRLHMHGNIKLDQTWHRFQGEEVIRWPRGMVWRATAWMRGLPVVGADRLVDGVSEVQWKLLGLFPVMQAAGNDVTRSAAGRVQGELVWLPSVLCHPDVGWTQRNESQVQASFNALGEPAHLTLTLTPEGSLQQVKLSRWGNPEGGDHHYVDFGVIVEANGTFGGYTIPTKMRAGWFFGTDRFEPEGEFFRCTIDRASYH
ncbi:DUF6920 family protein [Nodosilinea sp. LEGE 07298]|uniref:DUF6920 family protein n=1 Tax=Nodosilinea sp. LEGE 07298 TaxID=2777970 RepID=UPI001D142BC1|nr:DUF6544 family protein [Nodosilinea sp. LEGE 07298]